MIWTINILQKSKAQWIVMNCPRLKNDCPSKILEHVSVFLFLSSESNMAIVQWTWEINCSTDATRKVASIPSDCWQQHFLVFPLIASLVGTIWEPISVLSQGSLSFNRPVSWPSFWLHDPTWKVNVWRKLLGGIVNQFNALMPWVETEQTFSVANLIN